MQITPEIVFKAIDPPDWIEPTLRDRIAKLDRIHDRIQGCRVVIEEPHRHQRKGRHWHISIDLKIPGHDLIANRERSARDSHEDLRTAVRDAFEAVERQLRDVVCKRQARVKGSSPRNNRQKEASS